MRITSLGGLETSRIGLGVMGMSVFCTGAGQREAARHHAARGTHQSRHTSQQDDARQPVRQ